MSLLVTVNPLLEPPGVFFVTIRFFLSPNTGGLNQSLGALYVSKFLSGLVRLKCTYVLVVKEKAGGGGGGFKKRRGRGDLIFCSIKEYLID